LLHYSLSREETATIREQEAEIKRLEQKVRENEGKIGLLSRSGQELATHMNNIQQVDREIYKTLQGS
jgi:small-conductance mechanosensitive channel